MHSRAISGSLLRRRVHDIWDRLPVSVVCAALVRNGFVDARSNLRIVFVIVGKLVVESPQVDGQFERAARWLLTNSSNEIGGGLSKMLDTV